MWRTWSTISGSRSLSKVSLTRNRSRPKLKADDTYTEAKIYYLRNIIHDYPEEKAIVILKNTMAAMAPDSVILIDDMVVPNEGAHWQAAQLDFQMMTAMASLERTRDQWYELMGKAGLKIVKMYTYTTSLQDNIIECVPA